MYGPRPPTREPGLQRTVSRPGPQSETHSGGVSESAPGLDSLPRRGGFSASSKAPVASPDTCQERGQQGTGRDPPSYYTEHRAPRVSASGSRPGPERAQTLITRSLGPGLSVHSDLTQEVLVT